MRRCRADAQRLMRELDRLQKIGVNNVRLLAGSETSPLVGAIPRGITRAPHDYDEALLAGLDFCLAEMAKRDMRGILFLSNYWQWSGSFAQYVRWITGEEIPDPDKPVMAQRRLARVHAVFREVLPDTRRRGTLSRLRCQPHPPPQHGQSAGFIATIPRS